MKALPRYMTCLYCNNPPPRDHQWQPKGDPKLTGGMAFQRAPLAQSTTPQWGNQGFQQPQMVRHAHTHTHVHTYTCANTTHTYINNAWKV